MTTRLAAFAAALVIGCQSSTHAQTPPKPPAPAKPSVQTQANPGPQKAPKQSAAQPAPSGKSVCVASAIGHTFDVQKIGLMVFGNSLDHVAVDSWGIDDAAVRKIQEILGKQFAVRRISIPKTALAAFETPGGGFFRNPADELVHAAAAASSKCHIYVTLTRGVSLYNGTNQSVAGIGILHRESPFVEIVYVYASYVIRTYDGDNFTALRTKKPTVGLSAIDLLGGTGIMGAGGIDAMYRKVDKTWWPATSQAAAQSTQLKNATRTLIEEGLAKTMPGMFEGT
jgi:hypothetical protein